MVQKFLLVKFEMTTLFTLQTTGIAMFVCVRVVPKRTLFCLPFTIYGHDQCWCEAGFPRNAVRECTLPVANLVILRVKCHDLVIGS